MKITKIEIRMISEGGAVAHDFTENVDIPAKAKSYTYQFHDEHGMGLSPIKKVFLPAPRLIKREGWIWTGWAEKESPHPNDLRWVKASWEEPE